MNENPNTDPVALDGWMAPGGKNVQLVYILYLASFFVGLTGIIGLVIAYLNRNKAGGYVETHYTWLIRTFWIGLLFSLISALLMFVGIGFLLFFAVAIWVVVRLVKGLMALGKSQPIPDPQSWLV
jgi:uncharacterized membrane protein